MERAKGHVSTDAQAPVLECRDVGRSFDSYEKEGERNEVLRGVNFEVKENEFLVLFGAGQCGKTTLLNILAGLDMPTDGAVYTRGQKVTGPAPERGVVYQKTSLFPWLTVEENVGFGLDIKGVDKAKAKALVDEYLDIVGLTKYRNYYPDQLSASMLQRVVIARAFATQPDLLLMDEPYGQLDIQLRYKLEDELISLWQRTGTTVLFITHNIEEAVYMGQRIMVLTNKPTSIKCSIDNDLPRPRDIADPDFVALRNKVTDLIKWW